MLTFEDACAVETAVAEAADTKDYALALSVAEETAVPKFSGLFFCRHSARLNYFPNYFPQNKFIFQPTRKCFITNAKSNVAIVINVGIVRGAICLKIILGLILFTILCH